MRKKLLVALFLFVSTMTFAQQLTYKNGRILDSENKKLSNAEVKKLLAPKPELLAEYTQGRSKATVGGFLLGFGIGLTAGDLIGGLSQDIKYPTALTYIGLAATIISIPVLSGHSKKIKSAVNGYNESLANKPTTFNVEKINLITNQNGIGMQITF